jgi:hypothetical protein
MNPLTGVTTLIGSLASILGMGGAVANQAVTLHREMNPPQQQMQAQARPQCPANMTLTVIVMKDGSRQLACLPKEQP